MTTQSTKPSSSSIKKKKRAVVCISSLVGKLANDLGIDPADKRYVLRRLQQEGLAFVTKILPRFSAYALQCVEAGRILNCRSSLSCFRWKGNSPCFLQGLLRKAVLEGCAVSLRSIRQFCDFFYKTAFRFTPKEIVSATEKYLETETSMPEITDWGRVERMRKLMHNLFPRFCSARVEDIMGEARPRFGPGAFAYSDTVVGKDMQYRNAEHYKRSSIGTCSKQFEPYSGFFKPYPSCRDRVSLTQEQDTAQVLFVPKDSRGPRTISKEPIFNVMGQLSFNDYAARVLSEESSGRINFADQTINQKIAKESSKHRKYATLDLKDASDLVQYALVSTLVRYTSGVRVFCTRFRTPFAEVSPEL